MGKIGSEDRNANPKWIELLKAFREEIRQKIRWEIETEEKSREPEGSTISQSSRSEDPNGLQAPKEQASIWAGVASLFSWGK